MDERKNRFSYAWVIVFICALVMFLSGFVGGYQGQWLSAVTEGLGLSRTSFALSNSLRFGFTAVVNLIFAAVLARWGMKRTFALGFGFMILAMTIYSVAEKVWHFYVAGSLFGVGLAFSCSAITSILLKQWIKKGLGTVMGLTAACSGLGAAAGVQMISPILFQEGNPLGFRDAYRLCGLILLVSAVVVVFFVRERKDEKSAPLERIPSKNTPSDPVSSKGFLYFVVLCIFLCNALLMGINSIYAAHMRDVGLDNDIVTWATSALSVMLILSKTGIGMVFDKWGLRFVLLICQAATIIGFVIMIFMNAESRVLAIVFALIFPFALPLETIAVPLIVEGLFQKSEYNRVLGYTIAASNIGFAVGPLVINKVYDVCGNYLPALYACIALMAVILVAFQIAVTVARKKTP